MGLFVLTGQCFLVNTLVLCFILPYRTLADTGNNGFVWLGNVTDMDGMGAFLSTEEETKWDSDNGCVYKIYTMSEMSG